MQSPMTVRHRAVAVVVEAGLPMAVATVVAEPPHLCAPTKPMAVAVRAHPRRLPSVLQLQRPQQRQLWWRKWLPNRLLKRQLRPRNRRCLQAAPVAVVQRPAERAKALLILLSSPIGSGESVGRLLLG